MIKNIFNLLNDRKGKLQKVLTVLIISVLILLIFIGINSAENNTEDSSEKIPTENSGDSENPPALEEDKEPESGTDTDETSPPIESDSSNPDSGSEPFEEKKSDGNESLNEDELSNDDSPPIPEKEESEPIPSNESDSGKNESTQQTPEITEPIQENNDSSNSGSESGTISEPVKEETPKLDIQISHSSKITRGEVIEIKATITNSGTKADNVLANWILPEYFEIVSGNQIESCGVMKNKESCSAEITVQTSTSTSLGNNKIKLSVSYEK